MHVGVGTVFSPFFLKNIVPFTLFSSLFSHTLAPKGQGEKTKKNKGTCKKIWEREFVETTLEEEGKCQPGKEMPLLGKRRRGRGRKGNLDNSTLPGSDLHNEGGIGLIPVPPTLPPVFLARSDSFGGSVPTTTTITSRRGGKTATASVGLRCWWDEIASGRI